MNEETKEKKGTDNSTQLANLREYFTEDINQRMRDMSEKQMLSILKQLPDTEFWIAILKYNQFRLRLSQDLLISGDPIKEPTQMARHQGIMLGLSDLQSAVIQLITMDKKNKE